MDLIKEAERAQVFAEKEALLRSLTLLKMSCFQTSIWDETLYKAWSCVVYSLIPNARELELRLDKFCALSDADEVVIFERATFLVISHSDTSSRAASNASVVPRDKPMRLQDPHRFEKISNIIKQFKLSCSKNQAHFKSMEVHNSNYAAYINEFTPNTYIMVVLYDTAIHSAATLINIDLARKHFDPLITN